MKKLLMTGLLLILTASSWGVIINVPTDQPTIQAGIDAAVNGDTVLVAPGTYTGAGNWNITFNGKEVVLISSGGYEVTTIITNGPDPADQSNRGFYMNTPHNNNTEINGFTLQPYENSYVDGGAIYLEPASPTIKDCKITLFTNNSAVFVRSAAPIFKRCIFESNRCSGSGAGINFTGAGGLVDSCQFLSNSADYYGGGVTLFSSGTSIRNSLFRRNFAGENGGGIFVSGALSLIENCTFVENGSGNDIDPYFIIDHGAAIGSSFAQVTINNSLFARNGGEILFLSDFWFESFTVNNSVFYNNSSEGFLGSITNFNNNMRIDPMFCDYDNQDYHIEQLSPCSPLSPLNASGELIGAFGIGCYSYPDPDNDFLPEPLDNCPTVYNPDQADGNNNGLGDACCCIGMRGNIDEDLENIIDVVDLVYYVDYAFREGSPPPCFDAADLVVDGIHDIADLVFMVDYQFRDGDAPTNCPE